MKRNTEKNREKLAREAVQQMDIDAMAEMIRGQLEYQYDGMSDKEFNEIWEEVFGAD